ncbi:alpha/beta hydrolase [Caulobacter sp.]|uniref:alpha/beta fold hydrolase n=1 Tax=Caulobacter sp. TaxID=78 RepID=UPI0025BF7C12|nr:alpha/beta hydrolase [Caulobacter sp.]MBQ1559333.1 alpha/beta hydrolase [Caulobacter sp.]
MMQRLVILAASMVLTVGSAQAALAAAARGAPAACIAESNHLASRGTVDLAWRKVGAEGRASVLLIAGSDQQMTMWPQTLLSGVIAKGRSTIVYDARDVGCSSHLDQRGPIVWPTFFAELMGGKSPSVPYDLADLTLDALAVMDSAGQRKVDIVGVSGGATVAAALAARYPDRVGRLVLVMANSGNPAIPMPADPSRLAGLPQPPAKDAGLAEIVAFRARSGQALEGTALAMTTEERRSVAEAASRRSWDPDGLGRAGAALLAAGDQRATLAKIKAPTRVVHGALDPLISPAAGREVASAIPGAEFLEVPGMGHALTPAAIEAVVEWIGSDRGAE